MGAVVCYFVGLVKDWLFVLRGGKLHSPIFRL